MPLCLPGLPDGNSTRIHKRKGKEPVKNGTASLKNGTAPHHLALQGASPRGEAAKRLTIFAEENFVSKILCRQGEAAKRLTIFALLCASTMRQGEDMQRPLQSAEADSFPDGEAGNAG